LVSFFCWVSYLAYPNLLEKKALMLLFVAVGGSNNNQKKQQGHKSK
jgi:hypothetical protein